MDLAASLDELQQRAHEQLLRASLTVSVAESCTGGLLGAALTDLSGSSAYFLGGVLAYADSAKILLLRVNPAIIAEHGAVSAPVALAMARGVVEVTGAHIGISITGIAGPTGATAEKPVGTTYIGFVAPDAERVEHFLWQGDRAQNRAQSVEAAYRLLVEYLHWWLGRWSGRPPGSGRG